MRVSPNKSISANKFGGSTTPLKRDIIVVGASSGGLDALKTLVSGLPADLPAAVFIVWHIAADSPNLLPDLLSRAGPLVTVAARDGEPITPGRIYVAPPDHHLLVGPGQVRVTYGPKENRFRPAVDVLFRSAALACGPRVIGVVLTGQLDDGTAGLWEVKDRGGTTIIQDPQEAAYPSMPRTAQQFVVIDYQLPLAQIAPSLARLAGTPISAKGASAVDSLLEVETRIAENGSALELGVMKLGTPTPYSCPACNGVLLEVKAGGITRFRCHTGHAYSINTLLADATESVERELWSAVRAIEENVLLLRQMAQQLREHGDAPTAEIFDVKAEQSMRRVNLIRLALADNVPLSSEKPDRVAGAKNGQRKGSRKAPGKAAPDRTRRAPAAKKASSG